MVLFFFIQILKEHYVSEKWRPWSDVALCGVIMHLSTLGICNAYLNICHFVGLFFDWPDIFL